MIGFYFAVRMNDTIKQTRFENGLTILTEKMSDLRSASIGFFFRFGARDEPSNLSGICHFIEHTVFKGTKNRTALEIAIETDRLGGHFDAFTSYEETAFTIKVVDNQIPQAFDLIADMLANPVFDKTELKREQGVIIEEIKMVKDTPEELISEIFNQEFFPEHSLGLSIAGTPKTVKTFNHDITENFYRENFCPQNLIIVAAGNVEHKQIVDLAEKFFGDLAIVEKNNSTKIIPKTSAPILLKTKQNLEQNHLLIATPFIEANNDRRYAAILLANILGGGTSSRLWQKVREENGLAYSVGSSAIPYRDCGAFQIFAAMSPDKVSQTIDLCVEELKKVKYEAISEKELNLAKDQISSSLLLGLEDSGVRAGNLAANEMFHNRQISIEETLSNIKNVKSSDLQELANEYFKTELIALVGLGNFKKVKISREKLEL